MTALILVGAGLLLVVAGLAAVTVIFGVLLLRGLRHEPDLDWPDPDELDEPDEIDAEWALWAPIFEGRAEA
jgi:hypothetical protein